MNWILENKEWLFSGVGIIVLVGIIRWLFQRSNRQLKQRQKGGSGSTNIQAGGDVNINPEEDKDE